MLVANETQKFAGEQAGRLLERLAFQINHADSHDPDAVHDLRVAIRRLSQTLRVFKPCFRGKETRKIRKRLKKIMISAGEVRNCDIALKLLSQSHVKDTANRRSKLQNRRKRSERSLINLLERWVERNSSFKWRDAMDTALAKTEESFGRTAIEQTAQQALSRMAKNFFEIGNAVVNPEASPEELHHFRIAAKKFRYTLELFVPLYGPRLNRGIERIKRAQNLLGDINDCATTRELVSGDRGDARADAWFENREYQRMEEFRRYWSDEFASRENVRKWIADLSHSAGKPGSTKKPVGSSWPASGSARRGLRAAKWCSPTLPETDRGHMSTRIGLISR